MHWSSTSPTPFPCFCPLDWMLREYMQFNLKRKQLITEKITNRNPAIYSSLEILLNILDKMHVDKIVLRCQMSADILLRTHLLRTYFRNRFDNFRLDKEVQLSCVDIQVDWPFSVYLLKWTDKWKSSRICNRSMDEKIRSGMPSDV